MKPHLNRNYDKQRVTCVMLQASRDTLGAWVSCYVHRGKSYCEPYMYVTRSSLARVQRVQLSLLQTKGDESCS